MKVKVRSFSKINLGLRIGQRRGDGFHDLLTVYQTIALHDFLQVEVKRGFGIEIRSGDPRVPTDASNTCYRIAELVVAALKASGRVVIEIEKHLPVQGGLGGASGNAVTAMLALERALGKQLPGPDKLRIAAEVGSDLPLFLVGGLVLGTGRGEQVYPLCDTPSMPCVVAIPEISVSTPKAFGDWDGIAAARKLTLSRGSDRMLEFGREVSAWLSGLPGQNPGRPLSGVPASGRGRAESPLLDLVQTGIENDFEQVVFPKYPELREIKCLLQQSGAAYASLSGSGSAVYGLFRSPSAAKKAQAKLLKNGVGAQLTSTLTRRQYWTRLFDC
ncbi:MAG TPA: 4-(cytidine 5'-diphospho)-2-C-methyl-D-erythritol kinase [Terriglobales bacterium]|nr:4-(cytidine 5'-diphospho)-2-C-methyl-D-erythritol kinase [Terriglobales bacterium]